MNYRDFIIDAARDCAVVAHRGIWQDAPENSLLAIERAIQAGDEVVEIDIRRSADGGLFLLHDDTLKRMAGLAAAPENLSSQQLAEVYLRNRDGGPRNRATEERLPSLEQVFELTRNRIFVHLDVKERAVIPQVMSCAKAMGVDRQVDIWGELTSPEDLHWVRETIEPSGALFLAKVRLDMPDAGNRIALLSELSPTVCEVHFDRLEQFSMLDHIVRDTGMRLWANTLDPISSAGFTDTEALSDPSGVWGALMDTGVSVIQTDESAVLRTYLAERRALPTRKTK